jgi:uncharacterized membrane protein
MSEKIALYLAAPTEESLAAVFEKLTGEKLSPEGRAKLRKALEDEDSATTP